MGVRKGLRLALHLGLFALGVLCLWLAVQKVDPAAIRDNLGRLGATTLALAVLAYAAAWLMRIVRLQIYAKAVGIPMRLRDAASTGLGANALNIVAPARLGDVAAFVHLREVGGKGPGAAAALLGWRLTDLGGLLLLALLAGLPVLALSRGTLPVSDLEWAMAGGAAVLLLAVAGVYLARHHGVRALLQGMLHKLLGARAPTWVGFARAAAGLWTARLTAAGLALALAAWVADALLAGVVLHAVTGDPRAYLLAVLPLVLANVAKTAPTTPGGIGVYELVFWVSLQQFGVDSAAALTTAVATHLLVNLTTLVLGLPGALQMGRSAYRATQ